MIFYTPHITPRLLYIIDCIAKEMFEGPVLQITSDRDAYLASASPRLNYSQERIAEGEFFIRNTTLLFEEHIGPQIISCFEVNACKAFFKTEGDFPFDIFAASFYLLSRYEEYLPHSKDIYGRFAHTESLAFREGFLDQPLVNYWVRDLKTALGAQFPGLVFRYPAFKFIPTYDIDIAWSYRQKGWKRNGGGLARSMIRGRLGEIRDRIAVLRGVKQDPYDAYEWLDSLHLYCRVRAYYFFLVARRQQGVDRNISPASRELQELIRYHAMGGYRVGIHPSWQSGDEAGLMNEEIEWLEWITNQDITRSRQHYIRFTLPGTYRQLLQYGIKQDYSMGYGSINGFRASIASSFNWYDLEKENATDLRIFPFCFMDANSFYEQKNTPMEAREELMHYYHQIRRIGGLMVTIWHNSFLGSDPLYAGWREIYEVFLKEEVFWD